MHDEKIELSGYTNKREAISNHRSVVMGASKKNSNGDRKKVYNKKEIIRGIKFVLFSASAGIIEFVSFALLDIGTSWQFTSMPG